MAVIRTTDATGAVYYDLPDGSHLDSRKSSVPNWTDLPPKVQKGWIDTWAEEASKDEVSGVETLREITEFLKDNKKRSTTSDAARKQLLIEVLSVPLADALKEEYEVGGKKVDLIAAAREYLGVPYATLASWAANADVEVMKEIRKRVEAAEAEGKKRRDKAASNAGVKGGAES